ncbi:iron complex outermembrane recepter protein [Flavobacterium glycines]|uniref:Iron complex outermembrane recepter protein n=2 Tax=Flavobacterium glycines TaxID=551990 RepID=A0A1G8LSG2_9FLAO|nr:iron complex outermembrane recepter protein [Flavobacterium glycines]
MFSKFTPFTFVLLKIILNKMKTKFILPILSLLFVLLFSTSIWSQERASIKGQITLKDNQSPEKISVILKNTRFGTVTDSKGNYKMQHIKAGNYILRISAIGYITKEIKINLSSGQVLIQNAEISPDSEELTEVVINGGKKNFFAKKENQQIARLPLRNLENPQVYTTISSELLKDQVVTNIDDALKNAPGVQPLWTSTGRGSDGAGYFSLRGFAVQPRALNGLPGISNGSLDPANIDRIEVIKGPSGTLFGSTIVSYGGLINITTKTPYDHFGGEVNYTAGSYGLNRVTADINTPLNEEKTVNLRINTAYHSENSFQDAGFRKALFVAPSLSYKASDRLSFLFNTEFLSNEATNATMLFLTRSTPLKVHNIDELGYDNKRSYTSNQLSIKTPSYNLQGQMFYKINDSWTSQTAVSRTSAKSEGYYSYLFEATASFPTITQGVVFGRYINYQNSTTLATDIQQNLIGDFKIGNMRNRLVAGLDYFNRQITDNGTGYVLNGRVYIGDDSVQNVNENVFGITNPSQYITTGDNGKLSKNATDALLAGATVNNSKTKQEVYSAYVSDVINFLPSLSAMASLRVDRFMNANNGGYNQTALSPKFGVVFQPILDKVSLFANYMNGFTNVAPAEDINGSTRTPRVFDPEHADQLEFGTKLNLFNDKLYATFSYYNIKVTDRVYNIRNSATDVTYYQDGAQNNEGFEAEIIANPIQGLNIVAGYSYVDAGVTKGDINTVGYRPTSAGAYNTANLWASYRFQNDALKGFGLGFGGNYSGENKITHGLVTGTFTIPEYTVLNSSIFYGNDKFNLTLKIDNIANADTYDGWSTIHPRNMRSASASFSYKF